MTVWGITMVRDEADVIGYTLRHMAAEQLDGILVADNLSSDGTAKILQQAKKDLDIPVIIMADTDPAYYQSRKMTALARIAAIKHGAEWIVPFDADEIWYARADRLGPLLNNASPVFNVARATMWNHYATALDPPGDNPFETMQYRTIGTLASGGKVAFRWNDNAVIEQGNHDVSIEPKVWADFDLEIRHFPYRSATQMISKATNGGKAYDATDLPGSTGAHWRQYWQLIQIHGEQVMADVFREHFWYLSPTDGGLVLDPCPYMRP